MYVFAALPSHVVSMMTMTAIAWSVCAAVICVYLSVCAQEREAAAKLFKSQAGQEIESSAAAVRCIVYVYVYVVFVLMRCCSQARTFTPGEPIEGVVPHGTAFTAAQKATIEVTTFACGCSCDCIK